MSRTRRRFAFTLIEVLIVVIIMSVLAATIIPQFSSSTSDAKDSSLKFNLHTMRSQIELYKAQHNNTPPAFATFVDQMTKKTNGSGVVGIGADAVWGPYIQGGDLPANPFNNSKTIVAVATPGVEPTAAVGTTAGWQYDASNGGFYSNTF